MPEICLDNTCDSSHCSVCGGHFFGLAPPADHYGGYGECESCSALPEGKKADVGKARKAAWRDLYPA